MNNFYKWKQELTLESAANIFDNDGHCETCPAFGFCQDDLSDSPCRTIFAAWAQIK